MEIFRKNCEAIKSKQGTRRRLVSAMALQHEPAAQACWGQQVYFPPLQEEGLFAVREIRKIGGQYLWPRMRLS
jgi:hypothetical protein